MMGTPHRTQHLHLNSMVARTMQRRAKEVCHHELFLNVLASEQQQQSYRAMPLYVQVCSK